MNARTKLLVSAAMAGVIASATTPAFAADHMAAGSMEKCYGIAKAGKNDCKTAKNSCQGQTTKDGEGFVLVPKGLCDRIVGGHTQG
ncbi:MAG: DUF2282 domain-containing protein [Pseudomonadota bacterium]|nr:DUF2282 domain-containing protein [Pseudomonadota bacterium]